MLSSVRYGAFLVYSPRGISDVSVRSRHVRDAVKYGSEEVVRRIVEGLATEPLLLSLLGPEVTLVPCPRSGLLVPRGFWPARFVAEHMVEYGLGEAVSPILERTEAVPKSSFQSPGARPNAARHYDTLRVATPPALPAPAKIAVVDDFVTKGNTLLAAASRVKEAFPGADVSGFALVRTLGRQPEIERLVAPCVGEIRNAFGEAERDP